MKKWLEKAGNWLGGTVLKNDPGFKLLVSCVKSGGLYAIQWQNDSFQLDKVMDGTFRGMARYGTHFVVVTDVAVLILDEKFHVLQRKITPKHIAYYAYHGVFIQNEKAYIVETENNTIGVYELPSLARIDEIPYGPTGKDVNHINDLYIVGDTMYISMFTTEGEWRERPADAGVILTYNLPKRKVENVLFDGLSRPHTVICHEGNIYYCNSAKMEVRKGDKVIFVATGFTRGLAIKDHYLIVGQSNSTSRLTKTIDNNDCGIHIFDQERKCSHFIAFPANEIYGILLYN